MFYAVKKTKINENPIKNKTKREGEDIMGSKESVGLFNNKRRTTKQIMKTTSTREKLWGVVA